MIQAALKAIMERYGRPSKVTFSDKSYRPDPKIGNVPLPELHAFMHGTTWCQRHLGAKPMGSPTRHMLNRFLHARQRPASRLDDAVPPEMTIAEYIRGKEKTISEADMYYIREALGTYSLTGTWWKIDRNVIMAYPTSGRFEPGSVTGRILREWSMSQSMLKRSEKSKRYNPGPWYTPNEPSMFSNTTPWYALQ
jgi:hypothetical protein